MSKYVLIADNNTAALAYMRAIVRSKGYEALTATDGNEAWMLMNDPLQTPDLAIVELQLPCVSGLEFCRRVKRDEGLAKVPVLVVADVAMGAGRDEAFWCKGLGCDDFLFKPFDPLSLLARIQVLMRSQDGQSQVQSASAPLSRTVAVEGGERVFAAPRTPKPLLESDMDADIPEERRKMAPHQPQGSYSMKDAAPDALVRLYLSAPGLENFGLEFDILDAELAGSESREDYIKRRVQEFEVAGKPMVLILSTESKESRNVAKVVCRRKDVVGAVPQPEVEEEYAFKKTYLGWKLIGVRKKAPDVSKMEDCDDDTDTEAFD